MRSKSVRYGAVIAAFASCVGVAALTAPAASAAQTEQVITCDGQQLTVRSNENNSSEHGGWSAAKIVSGGTGHAVPIEFAGSLYDSTIQQTVFSFDEVKGGGNGNHNQSTITCNQSQDGTLGDFLDPGDVPPPGTSADDAVTFSIDITVVRHS